MSVENELGLIHKHCQRCYSFVLCLREDDFCDFTTCTHGCGAVFHECKTGEHLELCPNVRVACVNAVNGCSMEIFRRDLSKHLESCPANVVVCMAEWNRWPVFSTDRQKQISFRQKNPYAHEGQLDYDLAMRDQRMLSGLDKVSCKTKVCLRNNLTKRFPAVPLPTSVFRSRTKDDKDFVTDLLNRGDSLEYHGMRMDEKLSRQMQFWQNDLDERIKDKKKPPRYWEFPELEKGNIHKHCAYCVNVNCDRGFDILDPNETQACEMMKCRWGCGSIFHSCKLIEHQILCSLYEEPDEFDWMFKGIGGERSRKTAKAKIAKPLKEFESLFVGPSEPVVRRSKGAIPAPPPMPQSVHNQCRVDIRIDTVTRLQTKPRCMYTFLCAHEFRRDEMQWHYRNVHSEILGGLNNWLEQRCPLAYLGCPFSFRRLFPHDTNHTLTYQKLNECFGVSFKSNLEKPQSSLSKKTLMDLPIEVMFKIFLLLDSLSLRNLSLTCSAIRDVCSSLLDSRGCVTPFWERVREDNKIKWRLAYHRWFFSTAIEPIEKWVFVDKLQISDHLQRCPFNGVTKYTKKDVRKSKEWNALMDSLKIHFEFQL